MDRPPRRSSAGRCALACASALAAGCYSDGYLEGLCENTGPCPEPPPESPVAFRITSLELIDPHTYALEAGLGVCQDSTGALNQFIADSIGNYDVSNTLVFRPLDPKSAVNKLQVVPAFCIAGDPTNCTDRMAEALSLSTDAFNELSGSCSTAVANSLNPEYDPPPKPAAPCFISAEVPVLTLRLAAQGGVPVLQFPLQSARLSASFEVDAPPQRLVDGTLVGFMSAALAANSAGAVNGVDFVPWDQIAGGMGCQVDAAAPITDIDNAPSYGQGVWMYFKFTAERVQWATDMPEPTPGTTTSGPTTGGTDPSTGATDPGTTAATTGAT